MSAPPRNLRLRAAGHGEEPEPTKSDSVSPHATPTLDADDLREVVELFRVLNAWYEERRK